MIIIIIIIISYLLLYIYSHENAGLIQQKGPPPN